MKEFRDKAESLKTHMEVHKDSIAAIRPSERLWAVVLDQKVFAQTKAGVSFWPKLTAGMLTAEIGNFVSKVPVLQKLQGHYKTALETWGKHYKKEQPLPFFNGHTTWIAHSKLLFIKFLLQLLFGDEGSSSVASYLTEKEVVRFQWVAFDLKQSRSGVTYTYTSSVFAEAVERKGSPL